MKGVSRYSDMGLRPKAQSGVIARALIHFRRFGASSVNCRSNGLVARQTVLPIFSILMFCCSYQNGTRWVETFLCPAGRRLLGDPDEIEAVSSLVTRLFEFRVSFPLCLEVPLCFAFYGLTLLTSLFMGPFSFILTRFVTGLREIGGIPLFTGSLGVVLSLCPWWTWNRHRPTPSTERAAVRTGWRTVLIFKERNSGGLM
jgi:hypothetical protein